MSRNRCLLVAILVWPSSCSDAPPDVLPKQEIGAEIPWEVQVSQVRAGTSTEICCSRVDITREQWSQLEDGCERLRVLEVTRLVRFPDDLQVLQHLPALRQLKLEFPVDDLDLEQIAQLKELRVLNLPAGRFSDDGLKHLAGLLHLELLRFSSSGVTDRGLETMAEFPSLRFLHLISVPITDNGLTHLHTLTQLESLYLDDVNCSDEAAMQLLRALPGLHFHRDQLHLPDDPHAHPH